jgi:hypothetical protein
MTQAKTDVVKETKKSILKEYLAKGLTDIKVSDDQRALLESCQTIAEADKALDGCLDVSRRRALHASPIKKVFVAENKVTAVDVKLQQQKKIVSNFFKTQDPNKKG